VSEQKIYHPDIEFPTCVGMNRFYGERDSVS